jgi:hypothetical protein
MSRDNRNFGAGRSLNNHTKSILAEETMNRLGRGSATENKCYSALGDVADFLKENYGIRDLEMVTPEIYEAYALNLKERLDEGDISPSTSSGYISALNKVFETHERQELRVNASQYGISRGERYSNRDLAIDKETARLIHDALMGKAKETGNVHFEVAAIISDLQRETGLRLRESMMIKLAEKDLSAGIIALCGRGDGAKNHRAREFQPPKGLEKIVEAQAYIRSNSHIFKTGCLISGNERYSEAKDAVYYALRTVCEELGIAKARFHGNRHYYAHESYAAKWEQKTGVRVECPVAVGAFKKDWQEYVHKLTGLPNKDIREIDREIRGEMIEELGHGANRTDIGNSYLGR